MFILQITGVPPSTNKLYTVIRGRKSLSRKGKKYKRKIAELVAQEYPIPLGFTRDDAFHLSIRLVFDIFTKTEGAKNRFIKWDVSNRVKALEDAVCESLGIDDSQILKIEIEKVCRAENETEQTIVALTKLPESTLQQNS